MRTKSSILILTILITSIFSVFTPVNAASAASDNAAEARETVEISNITDFNIFLNTCKSDGNTTNMVYELTADITIVDSAFRGIAYFNGTFEGNNHTITISHMGPSGSDYGLFRYIGQSGIVNNLNVNTIYEAQGSAENVGGLCGVNYGLIRNCTISGRISGQKNVGAIAGVNKETGIIIGCVNEAAVSATNMTGGIAGSNEGSIIGCRNDGSINTEEMIVSSDLSDSVDVSEFNLTSKVITRNNTGGIVGYSKGLISNCVNFGPIGYQHNGYNVGGIAGRQDGIIITCLNYGEILGRKDVGGIVGQTEPYIESEYLSDKITATEENINSLNNTLNSAIATAEKTGEEAGVYADNLYDQYLKDKETVSDNLAQISDSVSSNNTEVSECIENINKAQDNIDKLSKDAEYLKDHPEEALAPDYDGPTYAEILKEIQVNYDIINENLKKLEDYGYNSSEISSDSNKSTADYLKEMSDELASDTRSKDFESMMNTLDAGYEEICNQLSIASQQISEINSDASEAAERLVNTNYIEDISSVDYSEDITGAVINCSNRGNIESDLNAGGIAGNMNIEYDEDPEYDPDFTSGTDIVLRMSVSSIISGCVNYGTVNTKRDYAGCIVGLQEFGIVYDCEGYGRLESESGSYLGGIAGFSGGTIRNCYSLCNIKGAGYIGGITGFGYSIENCITMPSIDYNGECVGAIAGNVNQEGSRNCNYFASETLEGIDFISYMGTAEKISREDLMNTPGIPNGFNTLNIYFYADGNEIGTMQVALGSLISEQDFPAVPEKEGYYTLWNIPDLETPVTENRSYEVVYEPWIQSIASTEKTEEGRSIMLVEGLFYKEASVKTELPQVTYIQNEQGSLLYSYCWKLSDYTGSQELFNVRLYAGEKPENAVLYIYNDGSWNKAEIKVDGSYVVAQMTSGTTFALVSEKKDSTPFIIAGSSIIGLAILILISINITKKKKKKDNK